MKSKLPLLVGIITLSLTTIPFTVKADTFRNHSQIVAQGTDAKPNRGKFAQELGLTDAQKARLSEIRKNTRAEIEKVLTPEQRTQWETAKQNRQARRGGFKALNLSEDQRAQIKTIRESAKTEMEKVFTPEQKQKIEQMRQNRSSYRQQQNR